MRAVYLIEVDLDGEDNLQQILKEYDELAKVRRWRYSSLEEYDLACHYDEILGA